MVLISSLYCGYEKIEELDAFLKEDCKGAFGGEYTFVNRKDYVVRFENVIKNADYPISFHGPLIDAEPASESRDEYERFILSYEKTFDLAKKYNARHVVYHTSYKPYKKEEIPYFTEICIKNTETVLDMAKKAGVRLLIENLPAPPKGLALIDSKAFFSLFKSLEADIIIDTGHANLMGLDYPSFIEEYAHRVKAYHFHNNHGDWDSHRPVFDGTFDFDKLERAYKKFTPDADIVVEYKPHKDVLFSDIKSHAEYISKRFCR